ncbi:MAG TPA: glycosyltransferase family 4 protein [Polyangiaceae bacterium]|nr:glycosyltransferase family 4 protein [Polyangiaceae bacterium]
MSTIGGSCISHRLTPSGPLRVAFFTGDFYPQQVGGQGIYAFEVVTRAAALGLEMTVVCPSTPARLEHRYPKGVHVQFLRGAPNALSYTGHLAPIQTRIMANADVLHVNELFGMSVSLLRSKRSGLVISSHNAYLDRFFAAQGVSKLKFLPLIALERLSYPRADRLIIGSEIERAPALRLGVNSARIALIPYGVEAARFADTDHQMRTRTRARLGIAEDARVALFVGRSVKRKKPHVVARAFRALADEDPNFHGLLLGDGEMVPTVQDIIAGEPRVQQLGAVAFDDLPSYYAAADVFTLPSVGEGSISLAVLEAAAAGLPLVLTDDSGGQSAVFEPGRNGEVVRLDDAADLAAGLRRAFARSGEYGARSRQLVAEHFSWDACARQTVACYEEVAPLPRS